ncbi:response regulator [uncultured Methanoregula sp.]|uniref:response regulator n=1 Tax=uncultured Methanoregula sp. TaxID=1005933 RepID=UPI002AAAAD2E|nr:response regulator [uncultured Methanoregula sp.]
MIPVLYVDDDPFLLDVGKLYLERTGKSHIDIQESAPVALEIMKIRQYDVVLSDYQMAGMDGIMFLKEVRAAWLHFPFIIFTSRRREEIVIEALNCGADYYLQKGGEPKSQFAELSHVIMRAVERKRTNDTILHLNCLYAVLSRTNRAVIRIRDRKQLLEEVCRIAVDEGQFLMAWIGIVDPKTHEVRPVAACGYEEGYLSTVPISIDHIPKGMGRTGTAIRECRPMTSNDIPSDSRMEIYQGEAALRGYRSSASIPLVCNGEAIGAMRFYTSEFFFSMTVRSGFLRISWPISVLPWN